MKAQLNMPFMYLTDVLDLVRLERNRQEGLRISGRFKHTAADADLLLPMALPVLVEEVGEVARAMCEREAEDRIMEELIQVAAVAVGMCEAIMKRRDL